MHPRKGDGKSADQGDGGFFDTLSEILRKRPILVERGSFRPVTKVNIDMLNSASASFAAEPEVQADQIVEVMKITMRNLLITGKIDLSDFLARADVLAAAGKTVLISDYFEYYRLRPLKSH